MWPFSSHPLSPLYTLDSIDPPGCFLTLWFPQAVPFANAIYYICSLGKLRLPSCGPIQCCLSRPLEELWWREMFLWWLGMSWPPVYPSLVVAVSATREWAPGNKRAPRWRQVAASSCRYSQAHIMFLQVKVFKSQRSAQGLRIRRKLVTWEGTSCVVLNFGKTP